MRPLARWLAPCPLWTDFTQRSPALMRRPALLRFASDSFMDDLQALLADRPEGMLGLIAQPEDWRTPTVGLAPLAGGAPATIVGQPPAQPPTLKLYQPVHQRFYLVTAVLVCRMPGLPERTLRKGEGERVGFVLRRVQPLDTGTDADLDVAGQRRVFAWVPGEPTGTWVEAQEGVPLEEEERLALFPLDSPRLGRQLWAGLVPVARRQAYSGGRVRQPTTPTSATDSAPGADAQAAAVAAQLLDFQRDVLEPWGELDDSIYDAQSPDPNKKVWQYYSSPGPSGSRIWDPDFEYGVQLASAFILADFARQMHAHLEAVWDALAAGSDAGLGSAGRTLYADLSTPASAGYPTLYGAMVAAAAKIDELEKLENEAQFPAGYARVRLDDASWQLLIQRDITLKGADDPPEGPRKLKAHIEAALVEAVAAAVAATHALPSDALAAAAERAPVVAPTDPTGGDWYVLQCVYERPQCGRNCVPVVSDTTEPFRLASFFDPDAPARTLPVALPVDTTPAALRKYDRNVVFMLSDELRRQMSRVKSMKGLVDGDIGGPDPSVGFGVACSLSIPIITICALILLMILVSLLNIVFWWLPFFKICFPVPKLEAKS